MKIIKHRGLSENDFNMLKGSPLLEQLFRHRLVVIRSAASSPLNISDLGVRQCQGIYYYRELENRDNRVIIEFLFELQADMDMIEQSLTLFKMSE